jgi:hypothetical protein
MADDGGLIAIGDGGRADPYRYFAHLLIIGRWAARRKRAEKEAGR